MTRALTFVAAVCGLCVLVPSTSLAQAPAGTITGVVRDPSRASIANAEVQALNRATGQVRKTTTRERGEFSFPELLPGEYEVSVEPAGFPRTARAVMVEAGTTTTADVDVGIGELAELVVVEAARPQIRHDSAAVVGVITRDQIEALPLNGRSFLELAKLEPGLQLPTSGNRNRTIVSILGAPATNIGGARFTIDGGSVTAVGLGGAQMGFSQEVVQEFQVSTVNVDLAAGMTDAGAINVVTRGGGNKPHATAFYFFRDHHLAAYPVLTRDPANPEPFFQRQQYGVSSGGPIRRDRLFFFASYERNDQRAVSATTLFVPEFAHLSRVTSNPLEGDLFSVRLDGRINHAHSAFARYSRDGSRAFGPAGANGGGSPNAYPTNWNRLATNADQALVAVTSVLGQRLVNDVRVSTFAAGIETSRPRVDDCPGCLGLGDPSITVAQTGLVIGHSAPFDNRERRVQLRQSMTWQPGAHRVRWGVDWEHHRDRNLIRDHAPVTMTLYSPARVRAYNAQPRPPEQRIPLPASFNTIEDILQLPLQNMTIGIGEPGVPQEDGGVDRRWNTVWLYADDVWRVRDRLTVTYGIGWGYDGILNDDLRKPPLLAPILGTDGLEPTRPQWANFSPAAGLVWTPSSDGKTVVRAAAGRYYRPHGLTSLMDAERVALGPPGLGRQGIPGSAIANPVSGIPGVPVGGALEFRLSPTPFTGADLMGALDAIRAAQSQALAAATLGVPLIQITKQLGAANTAIYPADVPSPSAVHVNVGMQRELFRNMVVSADLVYRDFDHVPQGGGAIDANHYNSVRGPVIRKCTEPEFTDPAALCSRGAINVYMAPYWSTYKGLLLRVEKRFSDGWQFLGSYAVSRNSGLNAGGGFNLEDWDQNTGPTANDLTQVVNLSGTRRLPWQIDLAVNFAYSSAPPFSAIVGNTDFNGDGTTNDLLPGTTVNAFNRGMERDDLERLVDEYNRSATSPLTLPARYAFGDSLHSLDVRVSRTIAIGPRLRVTLIGDAFNLYNASNLTEYSGDLTTPAFGQPGSRIRQAFGSAGPRAFQLAANVSF